MLSPSRQSCQKPGLPVQPGFFRAVRHSAVLLILLLTNIVSHNVNAQELRTIDNRPDLDREKLTASGLKVYESKRLILVSDVAPELIQDLPALADELYEELVKSLGPLKPDLKQTEFQVTGFVIDAKERFEQAGVLPPEEYTIRHGRHLGYQFWMNNQTTDYYRRHLLLHEFTHCFMTADHGMTDIPPLWYTEGIAEYFATHKRGPDGSKAEFGVMPDATEGFEGWGRIATIQTALKQVAAGESFESQSLEAVRHPPDAVFVSDLKYAHAWALVWLIRNHPDLKQPFDAFSTVRNFKQFENAEKSIDAATWDKLAIQWPLFLHSLTAGFDVERSFTELKLPTEVAPSSPTTLSLQADREWQLTGMPLRKDQRITVQCTGRYTMHDQPRPWISEPQGITIDYWRDRPLGQVVGLFVANDGQECSPLITVGVSTEYKAPFDGELWLQLNDSAASRLGNSGSAKVTIDGPKD